MYKTLLLVAILFLSGCVTPAHIPEWTQTYEGNKLPDDQEVKLYHYFRSYNDVIVIDNVIYTNSRDDPKREYTLDPGVHRIDYYVNVYSRGWAIGGFTIEMKAGHTHVLDYDIDPNFYLFFTEPWETTVTLRDETDGQNLRIDYFPSPMPWDEEIQKQYEKHMGAGQ